MLDVRRLVLLRALAIRGSVTAVAAAMNMAPSSVSAQLAALEKETRTTLLRRAGRGVQLTAEAQALVARIDPILDALEEAEAALGTAREEVTGRVRLALFQSAAIALLPRVLTAVRERHPQLRLEVVQYEPETALHETWVRDVDLVVAEYYPGHAPVHWPGLDRHILLQDDLQLITPTGLTVGGAPLPPGRELETVLAGRPLPWVLEPEGTATRHWAEQVCRSAGFEPDVRYVSSDLQSHLALVASGNAVGMLPGLMLASTPARVARIRLPGDPVRTVFTSVRTSSIGSPAIRAVREILQSVADSASPLSDA